MTLSVSIGLAGDPGQGLAKGLQHPEDFEAPWAGRDHLDLTVEEDETIGSVLVRAARAFGVPAPEWVERDEFDVVDLAFIDFYRPDAQSITLRRQLVLVDDTGQVYWTRDWREVTYSQLVQAEKARTLPGDPTRPYLLLQPGIGNGLLSDFVTLSEFLRIYVDALDFVWSELADEIIKGWGLWEIARRLREKYGNRAKDTIDENGEEWRRRGMEPENLGDLLGDQPWTTETTANRLGITNDQAEAVLVIYGCARGQDGLWRKGHDTADRFIRDNIELLIHSPGLDRTALRELLVQRFREYHETGMPPRLDWNKVQQLPQDTDATERQAERTRRAHEERDQPSGQ